jgi:hypothetical protein
MYRIERIQRRFTKMVDGCGLLSYEECMRKLQLPSLYFRRRREGLIQVFKLFQGYYDISYDKFFRLSNSSRGKASNMDRRVIRTTQIFLIVHQYSMVYPSS